VSNLVGTFTHPDNQVILLERLPTSETDMSFQAFIEKARKEKIAVGISDEVLSDIELAFNALHDFNIIHDDINEGNVYLKNISYQDVIIPPKHGKTRPKKIRMIFSAEVVILDFEKSFETLPDSTASTVLFDKEDKKVSAMLHQRFVDIEPESSAEEIAEAVDEWWLKRKSG
jgi:hypothetical protein